MKLQRIERLLDKATDMIYSCETLNQLEVAREYVEVVYKRIHETRGASALPITDPLFNLLREQAKSIEQAPYLIVARNICKLKNYDQISVLY